MKHFVPDSPIEDDEYLFRAFHLLEWNFTEDRPSSAIFQSSNSVSVDRDGGRTDDGVVESFHSRTGYEYCGLVKHITKTYRSYDTEPIPDPSPDNEYHALVNGIGIVGTKRKHASKLSKSAIPVIMAVESPTK